MDVKNYLQHCQGRVNQALESLLPSTQQAPVPLHEAMRYALFNGGKRMRASLVYAVGDELNGHPKTLDDLSASIEMIHAFSLIHDDLPALDNDDLRRGKPSCHKAFGEATAILAGDALQTLAFQVVANHDEKHLPSNSKVQLIQELTQAIGSSGMAGGEELDILMENREVSIHELEHAYKLKTSYLIKASLIFGAVGAHCHEEKVIHNLKKFGDYIGLAFQIHDDILGQEGDQAKTGKPKGSDELRHKPTYPSLLGLQEAKAKENHAYEKAMEHLNLTGLHFKKLEALANYVITRNS